MIPGRVALWNVRWWITRDGGPSVASAWDTGQLDWQALKQTGLSGRSAHRRSQRGETVVRYWRT